MSVAEKYVWCARHRIEAVLANITKSSDYCGNAAYINDYSDLESSINNAYQDYINYKQRDQKKVGFIQINWYALRMKTIQKSIEAWMSDEDVLRFSAWFEDNQGEEILYAYTNISNDSAGIEETIWISSGVVQRAEFDDFIKLVNIYWESRIDLLNVEKFHAWQDCQCYCTPQEVCTIQSHKEVENSISIETDGVAVKLHKLVTECTTEHAEDIESIFELPSRLLRS